MHHLNLDHLGIATKDREQAAAVSSPHSKVFVHSSFSIAQFTPTLPRVNVSHSIFTSLRCFFWDWATASSNSSQSASLIRVATGTVIEIDVSALAITMRKGAGAGSGSAPGYAGS